ncbi:MAG: hypothetical protein HY367_01705 [Candidatus Aenigmarchaeota archaeon]|nr:hypothetical protein [Candidatus Aenigmarchaeota archaeon]
MAVILIINVLKTGKYGAIALVSSALMLVVYPYVQTLGTNIDLWFVVITPLNMALYVIFSALFGPLLALQAYNLKQPKACKIKSGGSGVFSSVISFSAIQCPGCVSAVSLFLPISATTFLATYNAWLTLASIALLLAGIYFLGGFKKNKEGAL